MSKIQILLLFVVLGLTCAFFYFVLDGLPLVFMLAGFLIGFPKVIVEPRNPVNVVPIRRTV